MVAKELCIRHYQQMRDKGRISTTKYDRRPFIELDDYLLVPLGIEGKQGYSKVDTEFRYLEKYQWSLNHKGYPQAHTESKQALLHQLIMGKKHPYMIDHINRDKLDNRRCNLRFVLNSFNLHNRPEQVNNRTGFKNVVSYSRGYRGAVCVQGVNYYTKPSDTPEGAFKLAVVLRQELGLPL